MRLKILISPFLFLSTLCFSQTPLLNIAPTTRIVDKDSNFQIEIRINNISYLHSYSIELKYNNELLEYSSLEELDFFSQYQTFIYTKIDSSDGFIHVDEAILGHYSVSGVGGLLRIGFKALNYGEDSIYLHSLDFRDIDNNSINVDVSNTKIIVEPVNSVKSENKFIYKLQQNYPNPFNPFTIIGFSIFEHTNVKISVYDILGREIKILMNSEKQAGNYQVRFEGNELPSGIYFYKLETSKFVKIKKMILQK